MNRRFAGRLALTALVASCLHGAPAASPTATLSIGDSANQPRARSAYAVVFGGPQGVVANRSEPGVTLLFNRALHSLEDESAADRPPAIPVRTAAGDVVEGSWRWVGTRGLLFTPNADLPGSTAFEVTVAKDIKSLEGEALASEYKLAFSTERPRVYALSPSEGAATLRPDASIRVDFNQRIEPEAFAKVGHLLARASGAAKATPLAFHSQHPKLGERAERTLLVTADAPLPLDASIELVIDKGLRGEGPLVSDVATNLHVRTYGPIALAHVRCPRVRDDALGRCQAHRDITVELSNAVMPDEFRAHLKLPKIARVAPPKQAQKRAPRAESSLELAVDPEFGKRYRFTLTAGLTDVYGQRLAKDVPFDVDIEAAFSQGLPDAAAGSDERSEPVAPEPPPPPPPSVSSRAIPPLTAELGISGYVVEAASPSPRRLSAALVNVPTFGLFTAKVQPREAAQVLLGTEAAPGGFLAGGYRFAWQSPQPAANTRFVESIDLEALMGPTRRGVGLVALGVPGSDEPRARQLVNLTDLAITAKMSRFGGIVWVTSLSTGKPVAGAEVSVGALKSEALATFVTDAHGVVTIPKEALSPVLLTRDAYEWRSATVDTGGVVFAKLGDDWTYERLENGQNFRRAAGDVDLAASREWQAAVFADRGVYRPGETVKLAAVVRQADARGLTIAEGREVRVRLKDARDESLFDGRAKLGAFGSFSIDVPIPKSAHLGDATASVELPGLREAHFDTNVLIADFKAVEFKVSVSPDKSAYVRGDSARFSVRGEYLFQAPMTNAAAHVTAVREVTAFTPANTEGFVTSDEAFTSDYGDKSARAGSLLEADATLDAGGNFTQPLDLTMPGQTAAERVAFESDVEDFTRQVVAGSASVLVHPAEFYVGVRRSASRFVAVGATVAPEIIAVSPEGARVPGNKVHVELMQRTWTTVVTDSPGGDGSRRSKVEDVLSDACDAVTAAGPASCALRVPAAGYFIVRATATDRRGNTVRSSFSLYALSDSPDVGARALGWAESDARVVKIEADKAAYQPGETAKLLVRSPFKEAEALVTVERGGVMSTRTMTLRGPMPVVEVPIAHDYFPNVFVSVQLVRGRVQAAPASGADLGRPDYRIGYSELAVSADSHRLKVEVKSAKKDYRPGDQLEADVVVRDATGAPMRADLTFYAVDEGVLMLTGYKTPDPLAAFTKRRSLAVFGMDSRDHLAMLKAYKVGERLANLGYERLNADGASSDDKGSYGGGGGDGPGAGGKRLDFRNTAFFEAGRVTAADGSAHFSFKLPDNLTSFRLMAVASTADRFGSGESSVTSSKRLMARPALPRAVRVGDSFEASVVVSTKALGAAAVDVEIASGSAAIAIEGARAQHVQLAADGSATVRFAAVAKAPGEAALTFKVRGAGDSDEVQITRKVALPLRLETVAAFGETTRAAAIALGDLSKLRGDVGSLEVHLASSALVGLQSAFEQLSDYPYGCTEQLASRMLPLVALTDLAKSAGVRTPARGDAAIDAAVSELIAHQQDSGGFGYWSDDEAVPWLSAYAVLALDAAGKQGTFVPRSALDRGVDYLRERLAAMALPPKVADDDDLGSAAIAPESKDAEAERYAQAVFIADVLATLGTGDPGLLSRLYDSRAQKSLASQAMLLHAMARAHLSKTELEVLAAELTARLRVDANAAFAEETGAQLAPMLDSPVRTTALALRALLAVDPKRPIASRLAKGLLGARKTGAWGSTQDNAWALMALDDYRKAQESEPAAFDAAVFLGEEAIGSTSFRDGSIHDERISLLPSKLRALRGPLGFSVTGKGTLFYSAELRGEIADLPQKPVDHGLYVQKTMRSLKLSELDAAMRVIPRTTSLTARAGELVVVDLIVESAEPQEQVVIVDPLPAGLEAIDFDLQTSGRSRDASPGTDAALAKGAEKALGMAFRTAPFHREMRDDRVLTFVPHVAPGLYHFRYLARATVVGRFVVPPTSAECMYSPEVFGRTRASTYEIAR